MRLRPLLSVLSVSLMALGVAHAHAETNSYFAKTYPFADLKTWDFKAQRRISNDPIANNRIWAQEIESDLVSQLQSNGFERTANGRPDFLVTYYVGLKEKYDVHYLDYSYPGFRGRRFRHAWGWPRDVDVWRIPYTDSTLIVDVIDARTNELVWRGYNTATIDMKKPDKRIDKATEALVKRFIKDVREREES
jgi:hypothetical protein